MDVLLLARRSENTVTPRSRRPSSFAARGTLAAGVYPAVPRPGQRSQITVAGTTEASRRVYAKIRPVDGPPCASSYDVDPGGEFIEGWSVDGAFSINANATEADPGTYLICLWLAGDSGDSLPIGGVRQQTYTVVRPPTPRVASIAILNCRTGKHLKLVRAHATKSVCMRYGSRRRPRRGSRCRWPT